MMFDVNNLFSDEQDLGQAAGSYLSDHSIDLGANGTDFAGNTVSSDPGKSMVPIVAQVVEAFTSGGSATVQLQVVMADDAALTSNLVVVQETPALAYTDLVAGYRFSISSVPVGISKRYLGLRYVIGTATTTAGTVTAGIVATRETA